MTNETMGNQQEMDTADLHWIAGIIEGEGWFSLSRQFRVTGRVAYVPNVGIANSDKVIISECARIFSAHHVGFHIADRGSSRTSLGKKPIEELQITGHKRAGSALRMLIPFLRGDKRARASKLLEFIDYRSTKSKTDHYGSVENSIWQSLSSMNGYALTRPSSTTREAQPIELVKI